LLILVASLVWQYVVYWSPELSVRQFLPYVLISLVVEMLLALALLMPIATTVVWYHGSGRRGRLVWVLLAGLLSTSIILVRVASRRYPIVSYATRERVILRTASAKRKAHKVLLNAAHASMKTLTNTPSIEGDGAVIGEPLAQAQSVLANFYKHDEAYAFNIWASPLRHPTVLVIYFEARGKKRPIWVAIRGDGTEVQSPAQLPKGAFKAMRAATESDDEVVESWPDLLELPESTSGSVQRTRRAPTAAQVRAQSSTSPTSHPLANEEGSPSALTDGGIEHHFRHAR
jgi:hypothetical protein